MVGDGFLGAGLLLIYDDLNTYTYFMSLIFAGTLNAFVVSKVEGVRWSSH